MLDQILHHLCELLGTVARENGGVQIKVFDSVHNRSSVATIVDEVASNVHVFIFVLRNQIV